MQRSKNRYFVFISASQQELRNNVEAVAEDALGLSAVFEDANGVVLQPHKLAYVAAPHECNHHQQEQFSNPVQISKMCILNIEPSALHRLEHCLDLPALLVCVEAFFRPVVRDENLQLRPAVAPFDPAGGQVAGLPVHIVDLVQALDLPHTQVGEQPGGLGAPSRRRSGNPKVLPDADMVADAAVVDPLHPVLTHELAIRQQAVDALRTEEPDIALYQFYPLLRVGGPFLGNMLNSSG